MSSFITDEELRRRIATVPNWYHAMELRPGIETPGEFDMRPHVASYRFPASLAGKDVLDVGASNGFFSFHLEQLGARRVVAAELRTVLDVDAPDWFRERWIAARTPEEIARTDHDELEAGFDLACEVRGSRIERRRHHVYELGRAMPREFDLTLCSNLLHHLRDPVGALESIRGTLRSGGRLILGCSCDLSVDASYAIFWGSIDPHVMWWVMSRKAILRMCTMAGFTEVEWKDSFRFTQTSNPEHVGIMGIIHAIAP